MNIVFKIQGKKIIEVYNEYLKSKNKKQLTSNGYVEFNTKEEVLVEIKLLRKAISIYCKGTYLDIKLNEVGDIERFGQFIIIENSLIELVIPIDSFKSLSEAKLFFDELEGNLIGERRQAFNLTKEYNYSLYENNLKSFKGSNLSDENYNNNIYKKRESNNYTKRKITVVVLLFFVAIAIGVVATKLVYNSENKVTSNSSNISTESNSNNNNMMGSMMGEHSNNN